MPENAKTPEIRFAGFTDAWEERKLDELFNPIPNNTLSRADLNYGSGRIKNVHYGDILIKFGAVTDCRADEIPFITGGEVADYKSQLLRDGDVLFADTAEDEMVGKATEISGVDDGFVVSGLHTMAYRPKVRMAANYLGYYLNSTSYHHKLLSLMQGVKVLSISRTNLGMTPVSFPASELEQSKIGRFFASLDRLMALHRREYDKTVNIKKAMLEKMFPKDGADKPEIRFAGFTDAWEERKLGELAEIIGGGTPSTSIKEYWGGDVDWYAPAEIGEQTYLASSQKKITELGLQNSSAKMLPVGTVLFTSRAGIGKTAILAKPGATNQGFQSIVPRKFALDSYFIFSRTHELKRYGETVGAGSTFVEVSGKQMAQMPILIPEMSEQRKLGAFFSNLDRLITLHRRELEKLQSMKKALLEKMFV